jgi:excinuclease UvrABC helicase subunit UvrB
MKEAAKNLDFEKAMEIRDILFEMQIKWGSKNG